MNTFCLVLTNDNVLDCRPRFEDEDGVRLSGLGLLLAFAVTSLAVVLIHMTIERASDGGCTSEGNVAA